MEKLLCEGALERSAPFKFVAARTRTSTDLAAPLFDTPRGLGTMPHSLIGFAKARMLAAGRDPGT